MLCITLVNFGLNSIRSNANLARPCVNSSNFDKISLDISWPFISYNGIKVTRYGKSLPFRICLASFELSQTTLKILLPIASVRAMPYF